VTNFRVGQDVFGGGHQGAYAEKIIVSEVQIYPLPQGMSMEQAAGVYGTYPTSYAALKYRAALLPGETCLIHAGAGGVGMAAVQVSLPFFPLFSSSLPLSSSLSPLFSSPSISLYRSLVRLPRLLVLR